MLRGTRRVATSLRLWAPCVGLGKANPAVVIRTCKLLLPFSSFTTIASRNNEVTPHFRGNEHVRQPEGNSSSGEPASPFPAQSPPPSQQDRPYHLLFIENEDERHRVVLATKVNDENESSGEKHFVTLSGSDANVVIRSWDANRNGSSSQSSSSQQLTDPSEEDVLALFGMPPPKNATFGRLARFALGILRPLVPRSPSTSLAPSYFHNARWQMLANTAGCAASVLATQAMLVAVGVGTEQAVMASAVVNWVMKDTLGQLLVLFISSSIPARFGSDPIRWRLRSNIMLIAASLVEVSTAALPTFLLPLGIVACALKNFSWLATSASRVVINLSFARVENIADITAKAAAQSITASIIGTSLGAWVSYTLTASSPIWITFLMFGTFSVLNQVTLRQSLKYVAFNALTPASTSVLFQHFVQVFPLPSINPANASKISNPSRHQRALKDNSASSPFSASTPPPALPPIYEVALKYGPESAFSSGASHIQRILSSLTSNTSTASSNDSTPPVLSSSSLSSSSKVFSPSHCNLTSITTISAIELTGRPMVKHHPSHRNESGQADLIPPTFDFSPISVSQELERLDRHRYKRIMASILNTDDLLGLTHDSKKTETGNRRGPGQIHECEVSVNDPSIIASPTRLCLSPLSEDTDHSSPLSHPLLLHNHTLYIDISATPSHKQPKIPFLSESSTYKLRVTALMHPGSTAEDEAIAVFHGYITATLLLQSCPITEPTFNASYQMPQGNTSHDLHAQLKECLDPTFQRTVEEWTREHAIVWLLMLHSRGWDVFGARLTNTRYNTHYVPTIP